MKIFSGSTSIQALIIAAVLFTAAPAHADEQVTLIMTTNAKDGCGPAKLDFVRVMPDGSAKSDAWRIPDGQSLVVTDVDWIYSGAGPSTTQVLVLLAQNLSDPSKQHVVFESPVRLGSDGAGGASEHMTTGFTISAAARPCIDLTPGPIGPPMRLSSVVLRGRLAPAR